MHTAQRRNKILGMGNQKILTSSSQSFFLPTNKDTQLQQQSIMGCSSSKTAAQPLVPSSAHTTPPKQANNTLVVPSTTRASPPPLGAQVVKDKPVYVPTPFQGTSTVQPAVFVPHNNTTPEAPVVVSPPRVLPEKTTTTTSTTTQPTTTTPTAPDDPGYKFHQTGNALLAQAKYHEAFKQYEYALTMRKSKLTTEEHAWIADAYAQMATCRRGQGYYSDAWDLTMKALRMRSKLLGDDSAPYADSCGQLADLLVAMGNPRDARSQYKKALEIREKHGEGLTAKSAQYLAAQGNCYRNLQDYDTALPLVERACKIFELVHGVDHADTMVCYFNLALVLQEQGNVDRAMEYHETVLRHRERTLGKDHPVTSASYMNIGLCLKEQGKLEEAFKYLKETLRIRRLTLGPNHAETAVCIVNLGNLKTLQKEYDLAMSFYVLAESTLEKAVGDRHPFKYHLYNSMAQCCRAQKKPNDAKAYYEKCFGVAVMAFGTTSLQISKTRINIGQCMLEAGDVMGSLEYLKKAHTTDLKLRPNAPTTVGTGIMITQMESAIANLPTTQ